MRLARFKNSALSLLPSWFWLLTVPVTVAVLCQMLLNFLGKNDDSEYLIDSQAGQRWYSTFQFYIGNYGFGIIKKESTRWSTWSEYSVCSVTCGDGISTRTRECINGSAGDHGCEIGETFEKIFCRKEKCAFWSSWSKYSDCSVTCGDGIKKRTRECISASAGEDDCHVGETVEQKSCRKAKCSNRTKDYLDWIDRLLLDLQRLLLDLQHGIMLLGGFLILLVWLGRILG